MAENLIENGCTVKLSLEVIQKQTSQNRGLIRLKDIILW